MKNYRITLAYDGGRYKGWQVQKGEENTIQGKLQKVLLSLAGEPVEVIGSGRTDAGVHAAAQTANFHLDEKKVQLSATQIRDYLNRYLPEDIAVTAIGEVPEQFHARYSCRSKTYRYRIHVSSCPDVFSRRYVYTYTDFPLNIEAMQDAAAFLIGTHDFKSFCGLKRMKKSTVRTITDITIRLVTDPLTGERKEIVIDYTGDGFLQNMVRILTGTLIECGSKRRDPASMPQVLESRNREAAGYTAPACGLMLMEVRY